MSIITLTTDFGVRDWFVGVMKGVILGINPRASIVDVTHEIPPGAIRAGAFALAASYSFFPNGTVHVAVIDPGVGGSRRAIAVQTTKQLFLGPDNGVLSVALSGQKIKSIRRIENGRFHLYPVSHTFHGRDIFAPVAAWLSRGLPVGRLGPAQRDFVTIPWPEPRLQPGRIAGEIVYVDRFGNAISNVRHADLARQKGWRVWFGVRRSCPVREFYQAVASGEAVAVPGSSGFLEIAVNGGSAAKELRLRIGSKLVVRRGGRLIPSAGSGIRAPVVPTVCARIR